MSNEQNNTVVKVREFFKAIEQLQIVVNNSQPVKDLKVAQDTASNFQKGLQTLATKYIKDIQANYPSEKI